MPTVLITEPIAECAIQALKNKGYNIAFEYEENGPNYSAEDVIAVINRLHPINKEWMSQYPNLKIISYHGVGYDGIDLETAKSRDICVTITPGQNSLGVAEYTIALILALSKQLTSVTEDYKTKGYSSKYDHTSLEITGKTLGLVGLGHIGMRVANIALNGFSMKVLAYDPFIKEAPEGIELVNDRNVIFKEADFISLHLSLNDKTYHSIGDKEFEAMKPSAFVVNCSRGAIVDQEALIRALQNGRISGAGLDVTDPEKCEINDPLLHMDNVIVSPHIAGSSNESLDRVANMCVDNIEKFFEGGDLSGKRIV